MTLMWQQAPMPGQPAGAASSPSSAAAAAAAGAPRLTSRPPAPARTQRPARLLPLGAWESAAPAAAAGACR